MTWVAVGVFTFIVGVVLIAFQPARELVCGRYEVEGVESLLAFIRGNETNCFWGYLYDFQTLITGLAAVAAAAMTIRQMMQTDRASDQRHRELMELTVRSDRALIERLINPQYRGFLFFFFGLATTSDRILAAEGRQRAQAIVSYMPTLKGHALNFQNIAKRKQFVEGARFMNGMLTSELETLSALCQRLIELSDKYISEQPKRLKFREAEAMINESMNFIVQIRTRMPIFLADLRALASTYEVAIDFSNLPPHIVKYQWVNTKGELPK